MQKTEKAEKLKQSKQKGNSGVWWHLNRMCTSLNIPSISNNQFQQLCDLDFSVSVRTIEKIMKEEYWV